MKCSIDCLRHVRGQLWIKLAAFFLGCLVHPVLAIEPPGSDLSNDPFDPSLLIEQPGVELSLVAEHPDVVTPTGIDVDERGSVWVIASHTHFRPDDYRGPEHDQILVFDASGQRSVFYDKTDASMDLELGSGRLGLRGAARPDSADTRLGR